MGSRFPSHATSTGRALLAGLSADHLHQYFGAVTLEALPDEP